MRDHDDRHHWPVDERITIGLTSSRILGVIAALVALLAAADVSNRFFHLGVESFLTLDAENSPATWGTSMLFLVAAQASYAHARLYHATRISWYLLAGLMLVCSFDEVAMIHERIEVHVDWRWSLYVLQPLIAVAAVALLATVFHGLHGRDRLMIGAAAAALVVAQLEESSDSRLDVALVEGALDLGEEMLELAFPALVLACALPPVWRRIAPVFESAHHDVLRVAVSGNEAPASAAGSAVGAPRLELGSSPEAAGSGRARADGRGG